MENRDKRNTTILYTSIALCLFLYLSTYLLNISKDVNIQPEDNEETDAVTPPPPKPKKLKIVIIKQPTTHISYLQIVILPEILMELYIKNELCTPEDIHNEAKHKIPKLASKTIKKNEPRAVLVIYIAFGLLIISFGAALLDLFRAKSEMKSPDVNKKKPGLTRRCSLADLTVLRHARKESMRKESIYDAHLAAKVTGRKVTRPPLRLD